MNKHLLIGTFHKTGTVWMQNTFINIAKRIGSEFCNVSNYSEFYQSDKQICNYLNDIANSESPKIVFDGHSSFGFIKHLPVERFKGFKVVRNPIDLISSAANYHAWSKEAWLHRPRKDFGGMTYHQKINALNSSNERYRFEINNSALYEIRKMADDRLSENMVTVKYEDLISDTEMTLFAQLLNSSGFSEAEIGIGKEVFWDNSVFGELDSKNIKHIQNKQGNKYGADWDQETWLEYKKIISPYANKCGYK